MDWTHCRRRCRHAAAHMAVSRAAQQLRRRAADALVGRGLYEAVGWTFTAPTLHDRLRLPEDDPRRRAPVVENPAVR